MTSIDASTLSRLVTRLVELGLVTRTRSTTSSREVVVRSHRARARELVAPSDPGHRELERRAIAGVPPGDLAIVRRSLRRMYDNMAKSR